MEFGDFTASVTLRCQTSKSGFNDLRIVNPCTDRDWQPSAVTQVFNSCLPPLSIIEDLYIKNRKLRFFWGINAIENTLWPELLLPFTAVKNLYLSGVSAPDIGAALQELAGDKMTEVLPSLQNIFLEELEPSGPFQENIKQFVTARQLLNHHITISVWEDSTGSMSSARKLQTTHSPTFTSILYQSSRTRRACTSLFLLISPPFPPPFSSTRFLHQIDNSFPIGKYIEFSPQF